ncbi:MAG: helix-turn-helix transcriptional regulator [Clostridia bacterium]|nr:helix-turn-helix transcriptional regulator [Clostridia bacterium]
MNTPMFPTIDLYATGQNIVRLRKECGLSVRDVQQFFGFTEPQAVYKWQQGKSLPSVDNLLALSVLFNVSMDDILVRVGGKTPTGTKKNGQSKDCPSCFLLRAHRQCRNAKFRVNFAVSVTCFMQTKPQKIINTRLIIEKHNNINKSF